MGCCRWVGFRIWRVFPLWAVLCCHRAGIVSDELGMGFVHAVQRGVGRGDRSAVWHDDDFLWRCTKTIDSQRYAGSVFYRRQPENLGLFWR